MKNKFSAALLSLSIVIGGVNTPALAQSLTADVEELPFGEYLSGRHALFVNQYDEAAENYLKALELDLENVSLNNDTLTVVIINGQYDEALKIAHRLQDMNEATDLSKLFMFFEKTKMKDYENALNDIDSLSDTGILDLIKPFFRAWIFAELDRHDEVEEIIQAFDPESNFNFFNYYQAGLLYEYMGDLVKAEEYYNLGLAEKGLLNLRAVEAYAYSNRLLNKDARAVVILEEYLKEAPQNEHLKAALFEVKNGIKVQPLIKTIEDGYAELFYTVATILMQDNVKRVATNFLQYTLYFKSDFPLAHLMQAEIFESDKYYSGAEKQLNKINDNSPIYFQSKLQRAWLFDEMELGGEALSIFKKMEKEYPGNRDVLNAIAEFYRMHERYVEAIPAYTKIVDNLTEETERDWVLYYTRGVVMDQQKRWSEAEKDFKKALELRPEQPMVLNYLAYSWVDRGMNYVEAKEMLERAVELRPNDGYIVDSLGWALFKMGDDGQAVIVLERAAQLQTQDWAINDHLGDAYWVIGRKNEARFQWRHALSLSPDEDKIDFIKLKIKNGYDKPKF